MQNKPNQYGSKFVSLKGISSACQLLIVTPSKYAPMCFMRFVHEWAVPFLFIDELLSAPHCIFSSRCLLLSSKSPYAPIIARSSHLC